jgi:hypothetical protein
VTIPFNFLLWKVSHHFSGTSPPLARRMSPPLFSLILEIFSGVYVDVSGASGELKFGPTAHPVMVAETQTTPAKAAPLLRSPMKNLCLGRFILWLFFPAQADLDVPSSKKPTEPSPERNGFRISFAII